jgi:hypothetical protein
VITPVGLCEGTRMPPPLMPEPYAWPVREHDDLPDYRGGARGRYFTTTMRTAQAGGIATVGVLFAVPMVGFACAPGCAGAGTVLGTGIAMVSLVSQPMLVLGTAVGTRRLVRAGVPVNRSGSTIVTIGLVSIGTGLVLAMADPESPAGAGGVVGGWVLVLAGSGGQLLANKKAMPW